MKAPYFEDSMTMNRTKGKSVATTKNIVFRV